MIRGINLNLNNMSNGTKAFPSTEPVIHDGMYLIDYFACHAPEPTKNEVESAMRLEQRNNPYNEYGNPKLRDRYEVEISLRYKWAKQMMKERERWI